MTLSEALEQVIQIKNDSDHEWYANLHTLKKYNSNTTEMLNKLEQLIDHKAPITTSWKGRVRADTEDMEDMKNQNNRIHIVSKEILSALQADGITLNLKHVEDITNISIAVLMYTNPQRLFYDRALISPTLNTRIIKAKATYNDSYPAEQILSTLKNITVNKVVESKQYVEYANSLLNEPSLMTSNQADNKSNSQESTEDSDDDSNSVETVSLGDTDTDIEVINFNMEPTDLVIDIKYPPLRKFYLLPEAVDFSSSADKKLEENDQIVRAFNYDIKRIALFNRYLLSDSLKLAIIGYGGYLSLFCNPLAQALWACMGAAQGICFAKHCLKYFYYRQNRKGILFRAMRQSGHSDQADTIAQRVGLKGFSNKIIQVPKLLSWFIGSASSVVKQPIPNKRALYWSFMSTLLACVFLAVAAVLPLIQLPIEVSRVLLVACGVLLSGYSIHKARTKKLPPITPIENEQISPLINGESSSSRLSLESSPESAVIITDDAGYESDNSSQDNYNDQNSWMDLGPYIDPWYRK